MAEEIQAFQGIYEKYVDETLAPVASDIRGVFQAWRAPNYWAASRRFEESAVPAPLQRTKVRVKRLESVLDKFRRMPDEFPGPPSEENLRRMRDALGARVVVYFPSQLAMVDREIRSGRHFTLSADKPPKSYLPAHLLDEIGLSADDFRGAEKKPSGYASLHYTVRLASQPGGPWFELQTRTMLEEVWGEVEHQIGYKPERQTGFSVRRQFRVISEHLSALDTHFDFLNNELAFLQANTEFEDSDLLNPENLPKVLGQIECIILQREINGLLRVLEDYGVTTVGSLLSLGRIELVEAIQAEYRTVKRGRVPTAFDVIPVLLQLGHRATPDDARRGLRLHIEVAERGRQARGG